MITKKELPTVVIVGRANVGKSTLFNRLSTDIKSITYDQEGVTRDLIKDTVEFDNKSFELIDTGGISLKKTNDAIFKEARDRALAAIKEADLVLFMCDGTIGVVPEDRAIAKALHKSSVPVCLISNKSDVRIAQENELEFERLGFGPVLPISAQHGRGIASLLEEITAVLPAKELVVDDDRRCKVVLLGKPNVGKSSLLNQLTKTERAIVADMPGTTREPLTELLRFYQEDILLTDTPGVRRKSSVNKPLETLMVKTAMRALENADIVLLLIDASQGEMVDQELKLAFYAFTEKHKSLVLLFNKDDLVTERSQETLDFGLENYKHLLKKVPQVRISCKNGKNVGKILPLIETLWDRHSQTVSDEELNRVVKDTFIRRALYRSGNRLEVKRITQIKSAPLTFSLKVSHVQFWESTQLNYVENIIRRSFDLYGVPIRFVLRRRK